MTGRAQYLIHQLLHPSVHLSRKFNQKCKWNWISWTPKWDWCTANTGLIHCHRTLPGKPSGLFSAFTWKCNHISQCWTITATTKTSCKSSMNDILMYLEIFEPIYLISDVNWGYYFIVIKKVNEGSNLLLLLTVARLLSI